MNDESNRYAVVQVPPLDDARSAAAMFEKQRNGFQWKLRSIENLFGRSVYNSLAEPLEAVEESADDAFRDYEKAIKERDVRIRSLTEGLHIAQRDLMETKGLAERAVGELQARYQRANKPMPVWLEAAVMAFEEPF